jgi:hypothetical protein
VTISIMFKTLMNGRTKCLRSRWNVWVKWKCLSGASGKVGFRPATRTLDLTPFAVSKLIARLEERIGTRLLVRTTRALRLTKEGEAYHRAALRISPNRQLRRERSAGAYGSMRRFHLARCRFCAYVGAQGSDCVEQLTAMAKKTDTQIIRADRSGPSARQQRSRAA